MSGEKEVTQEVSTGENNAIEAVQEGLNKILGAETPDDAKPADAEPQESRKPLELPDKVEPADAQEATGKESTEPENTLTPKQLDAAKFFKLDDATLDSLGDKATEVLDRLVKIRSDAGRTYSELGRAKAAAAKPDEPEEDVKVEEIPPVSEEEWGEDLAKPFNKLVEQYNAMAKKLARIESRHGSEDKRSAEEAKRQAERDTDAWFDAHAKEFPSLGKGPTGQLSEGSDELAFREKLVDEAAAIRAGYRVAHKQELTMTEALERAIAIVGRDDIAKGAKEKVRSAVSDRSRQIIPRQNARSGAERIETGEQKAIAKINQWYKKQGF